MKGFHSLYISQKVPLQPLFLHESEDFAVGDLGMGEDHVVDGC